MKYINFFSKKYIFYIKCDFLSKKFIIQLKQKLKNYIQYFEIQKFSKILKRYNYNFFNIIIWIINSKFLLDKG